MQMSPNDYFVFVLLVQKPSVSQPEVSCFRSDAFVPNVYFCKKVTQWILQK